MSTKSSGDATITEGSVVSSKPTKCRIPQRLPATPRGQKCGPAKSSLNNESAARRGVHPGSSMSPSRNSTPASRPFRSRPHSTESTRPKSSRKEEVSSVKSTVRPPKIYVPERERNKLGYRSPMPMPVRKVNIDNNFAAPNKMTNRPLITVPVTHASSPTTSTNPELAPVYGVTPSELWEETRAPAVGTIWVVTSKTNYRSLFRDDMPPSQATMKRFEEIAINHGISDVELHSGKMLSVNVSKLHNIPNKLVSTCEQTLTKRKEIIDWFETLRKEERAISTNKLAKKIGEFNAENDMLNSTLQKVKLEFEKEINEVIECVRKSLNDTINLQLRTEEMMYELTELNSQNADLRKQVQAADHYKSPHIRHKLEETEKELKEERCEKMLIKKRLARAEGQVKIGQERAEQLEAALEHANDRIWKLETTLEQQNQQNQKLQNDFDQELNKLTESIRENTAQVEEIARAREKLQTEKEDLEKRLHELGESYSESLEHMKQEVNKNIAKLTDTENKFEEEKAEREKIESKLEMLCAQLLESELRYKDTIKILQERETEINIKNEMLKELESTKQELEIAKKEIEEHCSRLVAQNETIKDIEKKVKDAIAMESKLRNELHLKEEYVSELENKHNILEKQIHESECKMACYEEQLNTLKSQIIELKDDFGDFENFTELREIVSKQRTKLTEATKHNNELEVQLQKNQSELEKQAEILEKVTHKLEQKESLVKKLREKEEEQAKIVKLLRNNVEMRTEAEKEFTKQLADKNTEINTLKENIDARKQQICQLEKIVLALEDQVQNLNNQRKIDQDKIMLLEKTIDSYETFQNEAQTMEVPSDNLDNLIRILEDELGSPFEPCVREHDYYNNKKYTERTRRETFEAHTRNENPSYQAESEKMPTKIVMGNFVKKTYKISNNNEQYKGDNIDCLLDRKKAITNMEPHYDERDVRDENTPPHKAIPASPKDQMTRNLHYYLTNQVQEKKCKMFKFAGHRL